MKGVRLVLLLLPLMLLAGTFTGVLEDSAYAQRGHGHYAGGGGHWGGGYRGGGHWRGGHGGGHWRGGVWIGGPWLWDPFYYPFYPYYAYPYYSYPYYPYRSQVIIREQPEEYIMSPAPQPPQGQTPRYWYYCKESNGYYPYVKRCPGGWQKVAPTPPPQDQDEEE